MEHLCTSAATGQRVSSRSEKANNQMSAGDEWFVLIKGIAGDAFFQGL